MLFLLAACAPQPKTVGNTVPKAPVRITGSREMEVWVQQARENTGTLPSQPDIVFIPSNSETGLRLLQRGRADIALVSWLPSPLPSGYLTKPIGQDAVVFIINPAAGITQVSSDTLRDIFAGRYLSWQQVGGNDVPIRLVSREEGAGARALIETKLMGEEGIALTALVIPDAKAIVRYVSRHEGAIGYVSASIVNDQVPLLTIDDVLPTAQNIEEGLYPLTYTVMAVFPATSHDVNLYWHE